MARTVTLRPATPVRHDGARVTELPPPRDLEAPVRRLRARSSPGTSASRGRSSVCVELLRGADREDHLDALP